MPKKKKELKPATVLKDYWRDNGQFADLFNAVLFDGESVIHPDELEEEDTDESIVTEHKEYARTVEAFRDNIKIQKISSVSGVQFVLLGLEHQEHIHYAMPMRIMGYDYSAYKKQYDRNARRYKSSEGMDKDEYLSRMKRADRFTPVITVLIYYGEKPWDGALSLHGILDIPERMKPYVNDYRITLVEAGKSRLKLHNMNNVDFFSLLEIMNNKEKPLAETRETAIAYARGHKVERSVMMAVMSAASCNIDYNILKQGGETDMWTIFEETKREGREEGLIEGREEGLIEGKKEMIFTMLEAGYACEEVARISGMTESEIRKMEKESEYC